MPFQPLDRQELEQYLQRIRCAEVPSPTLPTLEHIHRQHALNIPFENLNSWLGLPVVLGKEDLMKKIVGEQRGGYCFEHNLLFGHVLTTLGYEVKGLSARVSWMLPPGVVMPRTHMALLITLNEKRYLADVGFGGLTLTTPLLLDIDAPQQTSHETFRIIQAGGNYVLSVLLNNNWQDMYRFVLSAQTQPDYEMANWYVATHPQSRFVNNLIAGRVDRDGRHALQNQHYTRYFSHKPSEKKLLHSAEAIRSILREQFLIEADKLPGLDARLNKLFNVNPRSS
jgi:N-hydroxyarylamine O-acetyltransferase